MKRLLLFLLISTFFWQAACYSKKPVANKSKFTKEQVYYMNPENTPRTDPENVFTFTPEVTVYFDYNQSKITEKAGELLYIYVNTVLKKEPHTEFFVEGNTDSSGSQDYNMVLSEKRANEVIKYLTYLGANPSKFSVLAKGELNPIADNTENPELNRRVIIYRKSKN